VEAGAKILYISVAVAVVAGAAAGLWWWLGAKTIEVTTITAEADSTGPSLATPC